MTLRQTDARSLRKYAYVLTPGAVGFYALNDISSESESKVFFRNRAPINFDSASIVGTYGSVPWREDCFRAEQSVEIGSGDES